MQVARQFSLCLMKKWRRWQVATIIKELEEARKACALSKYIQFYNTTKIIYKTTNMTSFVSN